MLGYKINPADIKLIEKVNFLKEEFTETVCNIYMNVYTTYGTEEYYLVGRIFKDYKAQGCYTYINGVEKEYKTVKPVLNAIMKQYNCGVSYDKILEYTGLKKDIKETRLYKKLVAEELKKNEVVEITEVIEVETATIESNTLVTQIIENRIIELFPIDVKEILYTALQDNKNIMYTRNARSTPLRTKEGIDNVYMAKTKNNIYTICVEPDKMQLEYFDYKILDIKTAIEKDMELKELIEFSKDNDKNEFIECIESSQFSFTNQYSTEIVYNFILSHNINNNIISNITTTQPTPEPVQSLIIPNQHIIYTYKNISIYAELEPYTSNLTKQSYNCIRDITITKDNNIIYKAYNIYFPIDVKNLDLIDFNNYTEYICKFILSQQNSNIDFYWTNITIDKLIKDKNTFKFDIIIRDIKKLEGEQIKNIEYENKQNTINNIIAELETICTAKQLILYRDYTNIIIIDNLEYYNKKDTILTILKSFMDSNKDTKEDYNKWFTPFEVSNISLYDSNTLEQLTNTKALLSNYKHTTSKAV